jgi:hypothetical protein
MTRTPKGVRYDRAEMEADALDDRLAAGERRTLAKEQPLLAVERDCCTSGQCFDCVRVTRYGVSTRIIHTTTRDRKEAERIAHNWRSYNATVIPFPDPE